jgi:hypothetical protein
VVLPQPGGRSLKIDFPIDLTELKPQHIEELIDQLDEVTIDVDDPHSKVQVFCE